MKLGTYVCVAGVPAGQDCSMTSGMRHSAIHFEEACSFSTREAVYYEHEYYGFLLARQVIEETWGCRSSCYIDRLERAGSGGQALLCCRYCDLCYESPVYKKL